MALPIRSVSDGGYTAVNVTSGTNYFAGVGTVYKIVVLVSAAAASSVIDSAGTSATTANTILNIPASTTAGTIYTLNWPVFAGLSVVPGSGVTLGVSYSIGQSG